MNIFQLHKESGEAVNVWVCGQCGIVAWNKDAAERCCIPHKCKTCGKEENMSECRDCFNARAAKKERERFEKAEKVTEWTGWVYADGGYGYRKDTSKALRTWMITLTIIQRQGPSTSGRASRTSSLRFIQTTSMNGSKRTATKILTAEVYVWHRRAGGSDSSI